MNARGQKTELCVTVRSVKALLISLLYISRMDSYIQGEEIIPELCVQFF